MSYWNGNEWVANAPPASKPASRVKRLAAATLEASLITALTFGLIASTAFAGRGDGGPAPAYTGTITLAPLVYDANGNGLPNHGDVVTFDITTTAGAPFVNVVCTQNGTVVLNGYHGYFEGSLDRSRDFGLTTSVWQGGDAECTAYLQVKTKRGWSRFASTSFHAWG